MLQNIPNGPTMRCFRCNGVGQVFPFDNNRGIGKICSCCNGKQSIASNTPQCALCKGTGKIYDNPDKRG